MLSKDDAISEKRNIIKKEEDLGRWITQPAKWKRSWVIEENRRQRWWIRRPQLKAGTGRRLRKSNLGFKMRH